mgnify:CR=1 FL=1
MCIRDRVTLHHLLTHTSGFGYDFHHETLSHLLLDEKIVSLLDKDGKFLEAPLIEQPGKFWHYGIGVGWIGKIIENLSGQSLNDYMTEKLFKPLSMNDTSFDISTLGEERLPNLYSIGEDESLVAEVIDNTTSRGRTLRFLFDGSYEEFRSKLNLLGQTPLPIYL